MKKIAFVLAFAALVFAVSSAWQIVSCELAERQLQEDLRDLSVQGGARIGLTAPSSDDDLRGVVIAKAKQYDILLQPNQITVTRAPDGQFPAFYLAADYTVPVHLLGLSFSLHFTPSSNAKPA